MTRVKFHTGAYVSWASTLICIKILRDPIRHLQGKTRKIWRFSLRDSFSRIFSQNLRNMRERYREFPLHTQVSINHLWGVLINFDTFFSLSSFSYFSSFLHRVLPCSERMKSGSEFIAFSSKILQTFPVLETFQKFVVFRVWRKYFSLSPIHLVIQKT